MHEKQLSSRTRRLMASLSGRHRSAVYGVIATAMITGLPLRAHAALFDDLGGSSGVTAIANGTVDNALADDRIRAAFEDVNVPRLKHMIYLKYCELAGGPCHYTGQNMVQAHRGLHLRESDFNALAEDVELAMERQGIPYATQTRFLALLAPIEHDAVSH